MTWRAVSWMALALALAACGRGPPAPEDWADVPLVTASVPLVPEEPKRERVGELVYRGGLELSSTLARFGGLSGLHVEADGRFYAMSDDGVWFTGQMSLDEGGRLIGVRDVRYAAMRDENGEPIRSKVDGDAEDLARLPDGRFAVSFEQRHRILFYELEGAGVTAAAKAGPAIGGTDRLTPNEGLEALTALEDGRLVGAAEYPPGVAGNPFWIFPSGAADATPPAGVTSATQDFAIVGLDRLPTGDLIRIERFYMPLQGTRIQVRLIEAAGLDTAPPRMDGPVLALLEAPVALDNFEAVSAVANADGSVRLYLMSDDNFSRNQKTLLYAFDWRPGVGAGGEATPPPAEDAPEPETLPAAILPPPPPVQAAPPPPRPRPRPVEQPAPVPPPPPPPPPPPSPQGPPL